MNIIWSPHALERAQQRGGTWERFRNHVNGKIESREWEEWYEYDPRDDRGVCRNLLLQVTFHIYALVRVAPNDAYLVVSILKDDQYRANVQNMWSKTPNGARILYEEHQARRADMGLRPAGLRHNPFLKLRRDP